LLFHTLTVLAILFAKFGFFAAFLSVRNQQKNNTLSIESVEIYTDGACSGNPGPGGWGAVLRWRGKEKEIAGGDKSTTNNRMELTAVIRALESLNRDVPVEVWSDSTYVIKGITEWIHGWKKRGWKRKGGEVLNVELWKQLDELSHRYQIKWHWVKGHAGHPLNERADRLAVEQTELMRQG